MAIPPSQGKDGQRHFKERTAWSSRPALWSRLLLWQTPDHLPVCLLPVNLPQWMSFIGAFKRLLVQASSAMHFEVVLELESFLVFIVRSDQCPASFVGTGRTTMEWMKNSWRSKAASPISSADLSNEAEACLWRLWLGRPLLGANSASNENMLIFLLEPEPSMGNMVVSR